MRPRRSAVGPEMSASFNSDTYPFDRVQSGFNRLRGSENIPKQVLMYLLDLPDANGYFPVDDNKRARVRLAKYLWYDGARPLSNALPTPNEKLSMLFDGDEPVLNGEELRKKHPKGYRIYPQRVWGQSETEAATTLKCYLGRTVAKDNFHTIFGLTFEILVNVNLENTTRTDAYSRAYDIEQCIIEALHGVNMSGIGVVDFSRYAHPDNGSESIFTYGTLVGRRLKMSIEWCDSEMDIPAEEDTI